jgi:putative transposase
MRRPRSPRSVRFRPATGGGSPSTNPLERVNGEIKRRTNVVGIFPNERSILRLVGAVLIECHDEWQIAERRYLSEGSMAAIDTAIEQPPTPSSTPALRASSRQEIIPAVR